MLRLRLTLLTSALALGGATCGPSDPPGPPPVDQCAEPAAGTIERLEIGTRDGTFTPFTDGEELEIVYGSQGGSMAPLRLRLVGTDVPRCVANDVRIEMAGLGEPWGTSSVPLETYDQLDGSRATRTLFVISNGYGGAPGDYTITATALGVTAMVRMVISPTAP